MQERTHSTRRAGLLAALAVLLLSVALVQVAPIEAQTQPTPTPTDPLWNAFAAARDALEDKYNVDLTIVRNWQFTETEFIDGIDSCLDLEDPSQARQLYFGWRFVITSLDGRQFEGRSSFNHQIVAACDRVTEPAAGGGSTTSGDLPAPVAGSAAGGSFELGGHVLELNANTVNLAKRAGMSWVKTQLRYSLGQDPGAAAAFINAAHANGFKALIGIVGDKGQMGDYASYINSYSQFVGGVAALGADAIEVWNESNIDREWPAGSINGATYTQLLAGAFNAIKSRNGNTIVISGAPAPTGFFSGCGSGGCDDDVYMQQMAQAGAAQYMDCVGLHYNEGIIPPTQNSGDPRGAYPSYYFSSMLQRGYGPFGGKPVCFTELGYLSGEGFSQSIPGGFAWAANTSVSEHAAWLAGAATAAAQSGHVRLMIVWNVDFPFYTETDPVGGYAIFRPDGSCPACDTLGQVMH